MDNTRCLRALLSVSVYMGHNIMADLFLTSLCHIIVNVIHMGAKLLQHLIRDPGTSVLSGKLQLLLCLCQCDPQTSPGTELLIR